MVLFMKSNKKSIFFVATYPEIATPCVRGRTCEYLNMVCNQKTTQAFNVLKRRILKL